MTTYYPKLLQQIEITTLNNSFGFTHSGAKVATIPSGTYDSILEVLVALEAALDTAAGSDFFTVAVSYRGIISIHGDDPWTVNWGTTDNDLAALLGFTGAETVDGSDNLTATKRHLYGWYAPVPVEYPGLRRRLPRRVQRTDAGGASIIASASTHTEIDLLFDACLEFQVEANAATTGDDGYGSTIDWTDRTFSDWWEDVVAKEFRYYEDASDGTVFDAGEEGDEFLTCVRLDQEFAQEQVDASGYTYFAVRLPVAVVGS